MQCGNIVNETNTGNDIQLSYIFCGNVFSLFSLVLLLAQERASLGHWIAEDQSGMMDFTIREDTLELIVPEGLTLWYKDRLTGDYEISYHICMVMNGGEHDRLSDMNCFWAANDPETPRQIISPLHLAKWYLP